MTISPVAKVKQQNIIKVNALQLTAAVLHRSLPWHFGDRIARDFLYVQITMGTVMVIVVMMDCAAEVRGHTI